MKTLLLKVEVPDGYIMPETIELWNSKSEETDVILTEIPIPTDEQIDMHFPADEINRHIGERIGAKWLKSKILEL